MKFFSPFLILCILMNLPQNVLAVEVKSVTKNNITAWTIEEKSLPIISLRLAFRHAGGSYVEDGKEGLPYVVSELLSEGAGSLDQTAFQKKLEEHAIYLSSSVDKDHFYVNLKTLKKNVHTAFEMLALMLHSPRFDTSSIDIVKERALTSLEQKMQTPHYLASLKWNKTIFGTHPYHKELYGSRESLASITRSDIVTWFNQHISKENMIAAAVGDINEGDINTLFSNHLNALQDTRPIEIEELPCFTNFPTTASLFMPLENPQAFILFGLPGLDYTDPDFYPAYVMNYVLGGGGFESRLMEEIREKRGLAYTAGSYLSAFDKAAVLQGSIGTKNESVEEVITLLKEQLAHIAAHGITREEFNTAKSYLTGSFALKLDTNDKLVNFLMHMQLKSMGQDFLDRRNKMVQDVTQEEIKSIAKKLLDPNYLTIVSIGNFPDKKLTKQK